MAISGGARANLTGNALEKYVEHCLLSGGYIFVSRKVFKSVIGEGRPVYTKQFPAGTSIYNTPISADFAVYHPQKCPGCLIIEVKWQQVGGSVDEKYPYLVLNIQRRYPYHTILLLDGGGYKKGAEQWIRDQAGSGNLAYVFNMSQFQTWANKGGI